jgi:serine protease Do
VIHKYSQQSKNSVLLANFLAIAVSSSFLLNTTLVQATAIPIQSNTVADLAEAMAPAVVNIEVNQTITQPAMPFMNMPFGNFDFFFNGQRVNPQQQPPQQGKPAPSSTNTPPAPRIEKRNAGSGFIVQQDGYIVTNRHVVHGASKIKITLSDKRIFDAKVVGEDNFSDLAVIKIEAINLPIASLGTSSTLRPGDFVIAMGSPLGYDHTVTFGIVSAVGRAVTDVNGNINFIQTDAPINPGNSGGPLVNMDGGVVGVNTAMQANAQNIGFSIPIDVAKSVIDSLINHRKILRPWLGMAMQDMDEVAAKSLGLPVTTKGVLIAQTIESSPAQSAGLERGDIIQKIDGKDVNSSKEVQEIVRGHKVNDTINFFILHNNMGKAVAVHIGEYPSDKIAADDNTSSEK